jgi:hypothetical protein
MGYKLGADKLDDIILRNNKLEDFQQFLVDMGLDYTLVPLRLSSGQTVIGAKFENGAVITSVELIEAGLIKKTLCGVKVLGGSKLTKAFTVKAAKFSASAKEAIEEAGGSIEVIE